MKRYAPYFICFLVAGCAGQNYLAETYGQVAPHVVVTARDRFSVWDDARAGKVLVMVGQPSGVVANWNFSSYPEPYFREAAEQYLAGRCTVVEGVKILEQRFEFRYRCPSA